MHPKLATTKIMKTTLSPLCGPKYMCILKHTHMNIIACFHSCLLMSRIADLKVLLWVDVLTWKVFLACNYQASFFFFLILLKLNDLCFEIPGWF